MLKFLLPSLVIISSFKKQIWPEHGDNSIFRVAYASGNIIYFSGHVQSHLTIDDLEITNDRNHGIFLYKTIEN